MYKIHKFIDITITNYTYSNFISMWLDDNVIVYLLKLQRWKWWPSKNTGKC